MPIASPRADFPITIPPVGYSTFRLDTCAYRVNLGAEYNSRVSTMSGTPVSIHVLDQTWPDFLNLWERDPDAATRAFAEFAYKLLESRPPKALRDLTPEQRQDAIQDIILHFIQDNCRILRSYRNTGHAFSAWFLTVANNRTWDMFRKTSTESKKTVSGEAAGDQGGLIEFAATDDASPEALSKQRRVLDAVRKCLKQLGTKCQILLQAAAEEYTPQEMMILGGLQGMTNKQISDDLRACRKRLLLLLQTEGVAWQDTGF